MQSVTTEFLENKIKQHRDTLLDVTYKVGGSYLAQALSGIDMMTAVYCRYLKHFPDKPLSPQRDRFLLSPGHYALPLYVILADQGYFDHELLYTFKDNGSPLELATHKDTVPGVEVSGGSLGQALSVGVGMALHAKLRKKDFRVFVMMSDGEQDEGQIWEAAASASHFGLDNLTALIDKNGFQVDGPTSEVMNMESLSEKYRAFGWEVEQGDGHCADTIIKTMDRLITVRDKPSIFIGKTIRGKGISFMENNPDFHYTRLNENQRDKARQEWLADWDAV